MNYSTYLNNLRKRHLPKVEIATTTLTRITRSILKISDSRLENSYITIQATIFDINIQYTIPLPYTMLPPISACSELIPPIYQVQSPTKPPLIDLPLSVIPYQDLLTVCSYQDIWNKALLKHTLHMFDRVHIGRFIRRPFHQLKYLFLKPLLCNICCIYSSIVLLENKVMFSIC